MFLAVFRFFFSFTALACLSASALADQRLVFSVDLIRHGDRNPVYEIPTAPYPWRGGLSALTDQGSRRMFDLGSALRREYVETNGLLPKECDPATVHVRSTDYPRTISSALSVLDGLYPSTYGPDIRIEIVSRQEDKLLLPQGPESAQEAEDIRYWKQNWWYGKTQNMRSEIDLWSKAIGMELRSFDDLNILADNLFIRLWQGVPLPAGIDKAAAEKIISMVDAYDFEFYQSEAVSGRTGRAILSTVKKYFDENNRKASKLRYVLFSTHDTTLMTVLSTLKTRFKCPGFGARLNLSLFEDGNRRTVKVSLNGTPVVVPGCGTECSFSDFFAGLGI